MLRPSSQRLVFVAGGLVRRAMGMSPMAAAWPGLRELRRVTRVPCLAPINRLKHASNEDPRRGVGVGLHQAGQRC
jgi:hypothetical protein